MRVYPFKVALAGLAIWLHKHKPDDPGKIPDFVGLPPRPRILRPLGG